MPSIVQCLKLEQKEDILKGVSNEMDQAESGIYHSIGIL